MGMVDIGAKPVVNRKAEAAGSIFLSGDTIKKIESGQIKKGSPIPVAEVAAINAAKQTHILIPHCHQILLHSVNVTFKILKDHIEARCVVGARARTGVEMEALIGVSIALNTIWDMVKYLEKDEKGRYPSTRIADIRVLKKEKGEPAW